MENVFDELNKIYELPIADEDFLYAFLVGLLTDLLNKGISKNELTHYAGYFPDNEIETFRKALDYAEKYPRIYYCRLMTSNDGNSYSITNIKTGEENIIPAKEMEEYLVKYDKEIIPSRGKGIHSEKENRWGWNFYLRVK